MALSGRIDQVSENRTQIVVVRFHSALTAISHAADRNLSGSVMMIGTRADCGRAGAGFSQSAHGSPSNSGGEERRDGQNGHESSNDAHVFDGEPRDLLYQISVNSGVRIRAVEGGVLGGKGVRRGEGVFELAAKGSAQHLGGSNRSAGRH